MGVVRDSQRTRSRILAAARREFAHRGYWGGRVGEIASCAGVNKRMLYHYFHSKYGLFEAVLEQASSDDDSETCNQSDQWQEKRTTTLLQIWHSLLLEESDQPGAAPELESIYAARTALQTLRQAQIERKLPVELSPVFLQLALLGLELLPGVLPQLVRDLTGESPATANFQRRRESFRQSLLGVLKQHAAATPRDSKGKPRIRLGG